MPLEILSNTILSFKFLKYSFRVNSFIFLKFILNYCAIQKVCYYLYNQAIWDQKIENLYKINE